MEHDFESLDTVLDRYDAVCLALIRIYRDIPSCSNQEMGYSLLATNQDFVCTAKILHSVLETLNEINVSAQEPNLEWKHVASAIEFATRKIKSLLSSNICNGLNILAKRADINLDDCAPIDFLKMLSSSKSKLRFAGLVKNWSLLCFTLFRYFC